MDEELNKDEEVLYEVKGKELEIIMDGEEKGLDSHRQWLGSRLRITDAIVAPQSTQLVTMA